jgi:hypothetical protein
MKKVTSILFTFLTLWISMHMGLASHFCRGELAQVKLLYGSGNAGCEMHCTNTDLPSHDKGDRVSPQPCCTDVFTEISSEEYPPVKSNIPTIAYFNSNITGHITILSSLYTGRLTLNRPPPLIAGVSLPFIQVFII